MMRTLDNVYGYKIEKKTKKKKEKDTIEENLFFSDTNIETFHYVCSWQEMKWQPR